LVSKLEDNRFYSLCTLEFTAWWILNI
jgi:hypothetical protein